MAWVTRFETKMTVSRRHDCSHVNMYGGLSRMNHAWVIPYLLFGNANWLRTSLPPFYSLLTDLTATLALLATIPDHIAI